MTPNPHRGSDFNDFLAEEGLMTPTPRTDAAIKASNGFWSFVLRDLAQELERELEQERQDRKQADLDALRALGERNDARAIIDAALKALPVGYIPAHTPESLPGRVADLVSELAVWHHEAKRLEAELAKFDETAIEWWCEYQDLKAKALEP
jgi:hypothetical protein